MSEANAYRDDFMKVLDRAVHAIARWTALAGGFVLVAITVITVISITGRTFIFAGLKPVPGDFELVEAGTAFAVFSFLPWCLLNRGNASVEIFTARFPLVVNRAIEVVTHAAMLAVAVFVAARLFAGTLDKMSYGETTFTLQFPIWWSYAASMVGASVFVLIAAYCLLRSVMEFAGRPPATEMRQ